MTYSTQPTDINGAMNLVRDCVGATTGQRMLIVRESEKLGFYDEQAPMLVAIAARSLGIFVYETHTNSSITTEEDRKNLLQSITGFDHVVFFARVGDQIRFSDNAGIPSSTMCYTLNDTALNSQFGTACHHGMCEIKHAIDVAFENAEHIRVTCPRGTDYAGLLRKTSNKIVEVSLKRFPQLVPRPIPAIDFSGRVALSRFLLGTGSHHYEPYCLTLPEDVVAYVEGNSITHFEGAEDQVARVERHYRDISSQFNIQPWYVDSWHAGIHPACQFNSNAEADLIRWSGTAFGNPRLLHFHTCGEYAPGEIAWNIVDPTICLDDVPVWENGQLYPDRILACEPILTAHPNLAAIFANPARDIGLSA